MEGSVEEAIALLEGGVPIVSRNRSYFGKEIYIERYAGFIYRYSHARRTGPRTLRPCHAGRWKSRARD